MDTKNKQWLDSSMGKKLLMKMGWKEGQGLGVDGTGRVDNLKVEISTNQAGLGYDQAPSRALTISPQIDAFGEVLKSLNAESTENSKKKKKDRKRNKGSDEEEAKESKKKLKKVSKKSAPKEAESDSSSDSSSSSSEEEEERKPVKKPTVMSRPGRGKVRYRKFVDAKDTTKYSDADRKAIFGFSS